MKYRPTKVDYLKTIDDSYLSFVKFGHVLVVLNIDLYVWNVVFCYIFTYIWNIYHLVLSSKNVHSR